MLNVNFVGRTAGARLQEDSKGVNRLMFNVYTKIDKEKSQWVTCSCSGKFAETIAPWLMIERSEGSQSSDKYHSRLVNIIGRLQITREVAEKKHSIYDDNEEVILEIDVPYNNTSIIVWIDRCEFLDSAPKGESASGKELKKTQVDDDTLNKLKALMGK
jgi:hypothetical protein